MNGLRWIRTARTFDARERFSKIVCAVLLYIYTYIAYISLMLIV